MHPQGSVIQPKNTLDSSKASSSTFSSELEKIVTSKNPLAILFGLAKIRSAFDDIANNLLASIERTYFEEKTSDFGSLVQLYEKQGFYQIIGNYYADLGIYKKQKIMLDSYFTESYWRDVDFFFHVVGKYSELQVPFTLVHSLYYADTDKGIESYVASSESEKIGAVCSVENELRKKNGECELFQKNGGSELIEGEHFMPSRSSSLEHIDILCKILLTMKESTEKRVSIFAKTSPILLARDIYLYCIENEYTEYIEYFKSRIILNGDLQSRLIENLSDREIGECYSYLRKKLLRAPKYNLELNSNNTYLRHIQVMIKMQNASVDAKLAVLQGIQDTYGKQGSQREMFQNIVRKGLMYRGSLDMVDASLGITYLTRSVFYQAKKKMIGVDVSKFNFEGLNEARTLVETLDSSIILRFLRPFFIRRLAQVFSKKKSDIYYFIKFVLTIHSSATYSEYHSFSRFFLSLEAYEKKGFYGKILVAAQFGWVYITLVLLYLLAPLGVFISIMLIGLLHISMRLIREKFPEYSLVSNFQITAYSIALGVIFGVLGLTTGLQDNTRIVYRNFQEPINAMILNTSESVRILGNILGSKANLLESESSSNNSLNSDIFNQINYLEGKTYSKTLDK